MKLTEATVLFVDDEPSLRDIFSKWLIAVGVKSVEIAKDGQEALRLLAGGGADLLITDVRMPVMDGVGLVRHLAEIAKPPPSIIFLSGFGDLNKREMYALGVEAFISKPFDRGELLSIMEKAIAERSTLWRTPAAIAPVQSISIVVERIGDNSCEEAFCLGRGGFSASYSGALNLGRIVFNCHITSQNRVLTGEGYVRWKAPAERKLGIEFAFIDESCRSWVVEEIMAIEPHCFIPNN